MFQSLLFEQLVLDDVLLLISYVEYLLCYTRIITCNSICYELLYSVIIVFLYQVNYLDT